MSKPRIDELEDTNDRLTSFTGTSSDDPTRNNPQSDPKADSLVAEAEKLTKKWLGGSSKYEEAVEKLNKAAAMYKINKNWALAGNTCMYIVSIVKLLLYCH